MPSSNWHGPYAAIALGVVLAGLASWISWDISAEQAEIRVRGEQSANQHIEYAQDRIRQTCLDRDLAALSECIAKEIVSAQDHSRAERDLYAQQAMALWAKIMAVVTFLGLGLTSLGIYLVWGTLDQTKAATKAAVEAVNVTREIGQRQVRAYLWVAGITSNKIVVGAKPGFSVELKNSGGFFCEAQPPVGGRISYQWQSRCIPHSNRTHWGPIQEQRWRGRGDIH